MKIPGWNVALARWAQMRIGSPFAWGETDCALIAAEAFDAMTGKSYASEHRGRYTTERQALRYQRRRLDIVRGLVDAGCFPVKSAQPGDFIIAEKFGFLCAHVCLGVHVISAWPKEGVTLGELSAFERSVSILRIP